MAKDKTRSVVQKEIDRIQEKGMLVEIKRVSPTFYTFKFNFEIIKYHRQRVGRFTQYDPLGKYKKLVEELIIRTMQEQGIEIGEKNWTAPFRILIECCTLPKKGSGSKRSLLYKILGFIKRAIYPDLDNLAKTPMDIMNNVVWYDDAQAYELTIRKKYGLEEYTYIEVLFDPVDPALTTGRLTPEEVTKYADLLEEINQKIWNQKG